MDEDKDGDEFHRRPHRPSSTLSTSHRLRIIRQWRFTRCVDSRQASPCIEVWGYIRDGYNLIHASRFSFAAPCSLAIVSSPPCFFPAALPVSLSDPTVFAPTTHRRTPQRNLARARQYHAAPAHAPSSSHFTLLPSVFVRPSPVALGALLGRCGFGRAGDRFSLGEDPLRRFAAMKAQVVAGREKGEFGVRSTMSLVHTDERRQMRPDIDRIDVRRGVGDNDEGGSSWRCLHSIRACLPLSRFSPPS
ncbi:hypothetical protein R3P38DRAFT_3164392 [Favolaschia claudopus]|uniref:Uncharacterized protein n=1 Tax=Favolaschia claudopus TaxID=2862362 RepID=A0AAW0EFA0_9AGAR